MIPGRLRNGENYKIESEGQMKEFGSEHDYTYRQEVLQKLFAYVQSTDSFFVIGGASVGKTRLMDHIFRNEIQEHYLGEQAKTTWLIRVDLNRHYPKEEWHFYELLINSLALSCSQYEDTPEINTTEIYEQIAMIDSQVIESRDFLRALRLFELCIHMLCKKHEINLCILLDEFDEMYRTMSKEIFAQLRAIRDANKNQLCYGLFLRDLPNRLRDTSKIESFYELFSHRMIGLGPYGHDDGIKVVQQIENRERHPLSPEWREAFYNASGGHPGIINALFNQKFDLSISKELIKEPSWIINQGIVKEECGKIFDSLSQEEQQGLLAFVHDKSISHPVLELLKAKGLIKKVDEKYIIFSPIFNIYLQEKTQSVG
jgi:hypothetical protein